jgi:DNA-binding NarL/FixJ family response regulator
MLTTEINLFVVDSDELSRTCFCLLFDQDERLNVVGSAASMEKCVGELASKAVQVLIVKAESDVSSLVESLEQARAVCPDVRLLVLLETVSGPIIADLLKAYVNGMCSTRIPVQDLLLAVQTVANGSMVFAPPIADTIRSFAMACSDGHVIEVGATKLPITAFTDRETEILGLIGKGLSNAQIANHLQLSVETVKTYVRRIMDKSSIRSRRELLNSLDTPIKGFRADVHNP